MLMGQGLPRDEALFAEKERLPESKTDVTSKC